MTVRHLETTAAGEGQIASAATVTVVSIRA